MSNQTKIIFLGNGVLADFAKAELLRHENLEIVFHARGREDLAEVARIRQEDPSVRAVLASFGVIIKTDLLELFEPEGILNIHPSLLPKYRGASPIESAILAGDTRFGVSVMKLAKGMDAGEIYWQEEFEVLDTKSSGLSGDLDRMVAEAMTADDTGVESATVDNAGVEVAAIDVDADNVGTELAAGRKIAVLNKNLIYGVLATAGARWIAENIDNLPELAAQDDSLATFTEKIDKSLSILEPAKYTADEILRQIVAAGNWPKTKWQFGGINCIILDAHIATEGELTEATEAQNVKNQFLKIECKNGTVIVDRLQPENKKPMDAKSFVNGYLR